MLVWKEGTPTPTLPTHEVPGTLKRVQAGACREKNTPTPTLPASREGDKFPPCTGGLKGGLNNRYCYKPDFAFIPIEQLKRNDCVIGLDGQPYPITRIIKKPYQGELVGIRHELSDQTLWMTPDQKVPCLQRPRTLGGQNDWSASPRSNAERRKELRNNQTPAEQKLWSLLRRKQLGVKFRRQHSIGPYIADFYSRDAGLVIECDGGGHYTDDARGYDLERNSYMQAMGLSILRFDNDDIFNNPDGVYQKIMETVRFDKSIIKQAAYVDVEALCKGDRIFISREFKPVVIGVLIQEQVNEVVYALEVGDINAYLTEVCWVYGCGREIIV